MLSAGPVGLGDEDRLRAALITEHHAWWFPVFATHEWVVLILFVSSTLARYPFGSGITSVSTVISCAPAVCLGSGSLSALLATSYA